MKKTKTFILMLLVAIPLLAEGKNMKTYEELEKKLSIEGTFSLPIELSGKDQNQVLNVFNQMINNAYQNQKDPALMNMVGTQEVNYLLDLLGNSDVDKKKKILTLLRAETFNLAANNWPGWGDEGITLTNSDVKNGLNFAKFNHKLTILLNEPADKQATALWIIGTLHIALKDWDQAELKLNESVKLYKQAKLEESVLMAEGYLACINKLKNNDDTDRMKKIEQLKKIGTDDANFYASQLETLVGHLEKFYSDNKI